MVTESEKNSGRQQLHWHLKSHLLHVEKFNTIITLFLLASCKLSFKIAGKTKPSISVLIPKPLGDIMGTVYICKFLIII